MKTWIVIGLSLVGCSKKPSDGGSGGTAAGGGGVPGAFATWIPKDAAALWQGAWATRMSSLASSKRTHTTMAGDPVAIDVKGNKATVWDGELETAMDFAVRTPCKARFAEPITAGSLKGGTAYHEVIYVVQSGTIVQGSGAAGYRNGKTAVVCAEGINSGVTIVDDKGACTTWSERFGQWESKPDTCTWSQDRGKDVLTIGTGEWTTKVQTDGDVLTSEQFRDFVKYTKRAKDYADAKAQVQVAIDEADPTKQALMAGGVVGKTDTIVSLIATWGSDKSLTGKPFEITAQWMNSTTGSSNGETTYSGTLMDETSSKFTLQCDLGKTPPPDGLVQGNKVTAKGTLDESMGQPAIKNCTLTKAP